MRTAITLLTLCTGTLIGQEPPVQEYPSHEIPESIFPHPAPWDPWVDYSQHQNTQQAPAPMRAQDWVDAFQRMRQGNPKGNIYAIVDGQSIDNIVDMRLAPSDTLIYVVTQKRRKLRTRTVKVEELEKLDFRRVRGSKVKLNMP